MKTAWSYLKSRAGGIGLFILFAAIFWTVFALSGLPVAAVGYGAVLCAFFGLVYLVADGLRWARRRRALTRALRAPALPGELPTAKNDLEADYQRLVEALRAELTGREADARRQFADRMDYFTAWAHQIKTPIAGMELLLADENLDRAELKGQLFRIEQYTEMVLGYLRLDGGSDLVIARYDLDAIVRRAVKKYAFRFIRQGLTLDYEPLNERVLTDEKWLAFVIEQLLSNALKYTPRGGVHITLEPGPTLVIRDTGVGIAPEDLPMVFQKGYTGFNGRREERSTGIGLYLCRRVCDMLGHTISIQSIPGQGTAVYLGLEEKPLQVE